MLGNRQRIAHPPHGRAKSPHYIKSLDTQSSRDGRLRRFHAARRSRWIFPTWTSSRRIIIPATEKVVCRTHPRQRRNGQRQKALHRRRVWFCDHARNGRDYAGDHGQRLSGGMLWSLRFRNRDGGFYWHSEPGSAVIFTKLSIGLAPPSATPMMKSRSWRWFARTLLPFADCPCRRCPFPRRRNYCRLPMLPRFPGRVPSARAGYQVERAAKRNGDWKIISPNVDEAFTQYRPQFADENVPAGKWFYRIRAKSDSGVSAPSNIIGPVTVNTAALVDELADFSKIHSQSGDWKLATRDCRAAKEDAHRAAGNAGRYPDLRVAKRHRKFPRVCLFSEGSE